MKRIRWAHNAKTGQVFKYTEEEGKPTYPIPISSDDLPYITFNFFSKMKAITWAEYHGECRTCFSCRTVAPGSNGKCVFCGSLIIIHPLEIIE